MKEPETLQDLIITLCYWAFLIFAGYVAGYAVVWALFTIWRAL